MCGGLVPQVRGRKLVETKKSAAPLRKRRGIAHRCTSKGLAEERVLPKNSDGRNVGL